MTVLANIILIWAGTKLVTSAIANPVDAPRGIFMNR